MMFLKMLLDSKTQSCSYLLADIKSKEAVIIDPIAALFKEYKAFLEEQNFKLLYTLETHTHNDRLSASSLCRKEYDSKIVVSASSGVSCADVLVHEGDNIRFGAQQLKVLFTPGHSYASISFLLEDSALLENSAQQQHLLFSGDTLIHGEIALCNMQQGCYLKMFESVQEKLFKLKEHTQIYAAHASKTSEPSKIWTIKHEKETHPFFAQNIDQKTYLSLLKEKKSEDLPKNCDQILANNLLCGQQQTALLGKLPIQRSLTGIPEIKPCFVALYQQQLTLLDIREKVELQSSKQSIPNCHQVQLEDLAYYLKDVSKDDALVLFGRSSLKSGNIAIDLEEMGFTNVASLAGGIQSWNRYGFSTS